METRLGEAAENSGPSRPWRKRRVVIVVTVAATAVGAVVAGILRWQHPSPTWDLRGRPPATSVLGTWADSAEAMNYIRPDHRVVEKRICGMDITLSDELRLRIAAIRVLVFINQEDEIGHLWIYSRYDTREEAVGFVLDALEAVGTTSAVMKEWLESGSDSMIGEGLRSGQYEVGFNVRTLSFRSSRTSVLVTISLIDDGE